MKTKLLIFFTLIISFSIKAQEYTNLNEIDNGLNNPNQVRVTDDILYVATENQILSYDISQESPVATVVFTTPTLAGDELAIITTFNIRNGYLFIAVEVIDTVKDIFVENRVVRVSLSNTSDISLIETLSSYASAVTFDGSLLYRVTEDDDTGLSIISYRDVDVVGSTMTTLTTFDGIARDIDTFDNLVIISKRNGSIEAVNINDTTPILAPLNLGTTISTASGIHVLDNDGTILIAGGNKIYEGNIINEDFNLDLFNLIENTTYSSEGNNNSFNDVFVYEGFAYMTIADSGVVVKTDKLASGSYSCDSSGTVLSEFITNKTYLSDVFIDGNYLYICQFLEGITRVDLNDNSQTNIYTPTKVGQNQEVLYELFVNNNKLYFTSKDFDVDTFEITSSYLKEIDLSNTAYNVTTLASSSLNTEIISSIAYSNDKIIYGVIDETEDDDTFELYTYNTLNNNITNTGLDGNGELGKMIVNGNDLYYLDYEHGILKADVNALSNSPVSFLDANANNYYPSNFSIDNDVLYFSNGQEINKVSLLSTAPETEVVNVVTNGNIIESNGYGTTTCGYFEGALSVKDNTVYAIIANSIINFSAGSLSNEIITTITEDKSFYIENDKLYFKNNNSKGFIYNGSGLQVKTVDSSKYNYIDLSDLVSGIYIIKVNNESLKIIL